ncbi:MAG: SPOR domain-containing protein [Alphaproteobacteria bacterium]
MADDFRPAENDRIVSREMAPDVPRYSRRGRRIMTGLVAIAAVLGFGVVILYAYNKGRQEGASTSPPVIQAQEGPTKVRPESPGGMKVPNRDKEVFTRLEAEKQPDRVERLLPPPENPMAPPAPPAAVPAEAANAEPAAGTPAPAKAPDLPPPTPPPLSKKDLKIPDAKPVATKPEKEAAPKKAPVQTAAKTPAKAPAVSASGRYRIQISSLRSEPALRNNWTSLQQKHKDLLGNLPLIVERTVLSGGRGTYYRMQAGPLASRADAASLCSRLKQRKLSCLVVRR